MGRQGRIDLLLCETISRCWRNSVDVLCAIRATFTGAEEFIDLERVEAIAASKRWGISSPPNSPRWIPRKTMWNAMQRRSTGRGSGFESSRFKMPASFSTSFLESARKREGEHNENPHEI